MVIYTNVGALVKTVRELLLKYSLLKKTKKQKTTVVKEAVIVFNIYI